MPEQEMQPGVRQVLPPQQDRGGVRHLRREGQADHIRDPLPGMRHLRQQVPVRGRQDHRTGRRAQGGHDPPVRGELLQTLQAPGPQEGPRHRYPGTQRYRKDHGHQDAVRDRDPQPRPLREPSHQGGGPPALRGHRAARLPGEGLRREGQGRRQAAVRRQDPPGREGGCQGPALQGAGPHDRGPGRRDLRPDRGHRQGHLQALRR